MANPIFGFTIYVQGARDATWGTFPTIAKRWPVYSYNVKPLAGRLRPNLLTGSIAQPDLVKGMEMCQLDLSLPFTYTDTMLFLDAAMGTDTYASNGGATTGTNPYTHTWSAFKNLLNSLSFELVDEPSSMCLRAVGMKIQKMTLKCSAGVDIIDQIMRLDLTLIGKAMTEGNSPTGAILAAVFNPVLQQHMTVQTDIAQTVTTAATLDWELVIDTMAKERLLMEGTGYISEPQRERRPQWTLSMTREYQTRTAMQEFLANSGQLVTSTFTNGANAILTVSNGFGKMATYPDRPIEGDGWIQQKVVYEGQGDYANSNTRTLAIALTNAQASITA